MKKIKKGKLHFFTVLAFMLFIILGFSSTCNTFNQKNESENVITTIKTQSKMYVDIMGFNDNVILPFISGKSQLPPHNIETEKGMNELKNDIKKLTSGPNTAAYYALDIGLDRVAHVKQNFMNNDPNSKYYIIFLTDGLDNVSVNLAQMNGRGNFKNTAEYAHALQNKMNTNLFNISKYKDPSTGEVITKNIISTTNTFESYLLFYKGNDIEKSGYSDEELNQMLIPFTGSQNAKQPPVIMSDDLNVLFEEFENEFGLSFSLNIPKGYEGMRIRMVLNNETDNEIWFEGDFLKRARIEQNQGFNYFFGNILCSEGFTFENYDHILAMDSTLYSNNSNIVPFLIKNLKYNEKTYIIRRNDKTLGYFYDGNKMRFDSEFELINRKNAYILFILDTSISFNEKLDEAKETIIKIVNYINENM